MLAKVFTKTIKINNNIIYFISNKFKKNKLNLFMLSGWPVSCYMFEPIIKNFENEFNCLALDLPGFGSSTTNLESKYSFDYYQEFLKIFIKTHYQNQKIIVFGYSIGAIHAINLSTQNINNISKLILFSPPLNGKLIKDNFRKQGGLQNFYYSFLVLIKHLPFLLKIGNNPKLRYKIMRYLYVKAYQKLYPEFNNFVDKKYQDKLLNETNKFNLQAVFQIMIELIENDYSQKLQNTSIPSLVLSGQKDVVIDPYEIKKVVENNPMIKFKILKNTSHASCVINPKPITIEIEKFLASSPKNLII